MNKRISYPSIFIAINFIFLLLVSTVRILSDNWLNTMDHVVQIYELLLHVILIFYCYKIYSKATQDKDIFRWLLLTNIFFLAHDTAFYFGIFRFAPAGFLTRAYYPMDRILVNNCCFSVWLVCFSIFICSILYRYILDKRRFLQLSIILFIFSVVIISYYWMPTRLNTEVILT